MERQRKRMRKKGKKSSRKNIIWDQQKIIIKYQYSSWVLTKHAVMREGKRAHKESFPSVLL